jgi:hypothetical protein
MVHLGFIVSIRDSIRRPVRDQPLARPALRHDLRKALPRFHQLRTDRLQPSQKAALLLFDLGTVRHSLSGDSRSKANARRGVFRVTKMTVD